MVVSSSIEQERLILQRGLDKAKTALDRNKLGQFATPTQLARDILSYARQILSDDTPVSFLDPAIGTGSFYSALRHCFDTHSIERATGFEIDPHYALPAKSLWSDELLTIHLEDFTKASVSHLYNLVISNPPYVRHHHIDKADKERLKVETAKSSGMSLSGLAGLYGHFLGLTHRWLAPGALSAWLIPSEFMDVNYGSEIKRYLTETVNLFHIHRFDAEDVQFEDALVTSCVVWFTNDAPSGDDVRFTLGGSLLNPRESILISKTELKGVRKWTQVGKQAVSNGSSQRSTVGDWFRIRRGIATGDNGFFILSADDVSKWQIPEQFCRPILPASRFLLEDEIHADDQGAPLLPEQKFLLDCPLPEHIVEAEFPTLWAYLTREEGEKSKEGYLVKRRSPWYAQEQRPPSPLVCTYMGRPNAGKKSPFRFIRNHSRATATNTYLLFEPQERTKALGPAQGEFIDSVWKQLQSMSTDEVMQYGRTYGGGLHKLEPKELMSIELEIPLQPSGQLELLFT